MTDITTVEGASYTVDPDAIETITDRDAHGVAGTYIGIGKTVLHIPESAEAFLARIGTRFAKLTRADGAPVWINADAVSALGPPVSYASPIRTAIWVGSEKQTVAEDLAAAKDAINASRKVAL